MPEASTLALFTVAAITLLVIPGPSVLYIVTRSVDQGRAAGLASVGGIHVGTLVHVAAAALGLSALLVSSATAYNAVRWVGAAYLVWLGIQRLRARDEELLATAGGPGGDRHSLRRVFAQGIVVNVLNPKTALFFFAFLPQFVDPSRGSVPFQVVVFGVAFVVLGLLSDGAYAVLAATGAGWLRRRPGVARTSRLVSGGVLISLGVTTALAGSRSSSQ
ncbi:MAG TPA: LysE family translocator [Actinomycetota bacterium]|jgi:threonine/homoserine/homoserine lactone efflux protein|nr:LysE family translocator [Actinomycetota bacterium]